MCWGNICCFLMVEFVVRKVFVNEGLDVCIISVGVSDEEYGGLMDL